MLFFDIIQIAIGEKKCVSKKISEQEWNRIYDLTLKQAVTGVAFLALDKFSSSGQKPPMPLLYKWIGISEQIRSQNLLVNQRCFDITKIFTEAGFKTCILKGQGNAMMYPDPLSRTSGDIDIWVNGTRNEIKKFVLEKCPYVQDGDLHIEFPLFKDVAVEVHYKPSFDIRPKYERRLQKWFSIHAEEQFTNSVALSGKQVCFPTIEFNTIHQMSHIMNHFFVEGIGLRHFIDYYYVLKHFDVRSKKEEIRETFCWLGLEKFAKGVMWIEKEVLGIDEQYLILEPDERIGKLILKEMMEGGNFGHHDERYKSRKKGMLARGITDTYRLIKLMPYFPDLVLWKIWNKIENQRWKIKSGSGLKKNN